MNRTYLALIILTVIGLLIHFYNLNWGAPFYFHPDERNIASAVSQLHYPTQMNPHFFAYGSLPIYTIYFTGMLVQSFNHSLPTDPFILAILVSRFYSALFATLLIPILYIIGKQLRDERTGLLAALFTATSVGFIQFAHFGTFEMWLTFFSVVLFFICLQKLTIKTVLLMGICFGILAATKVSSLVLLPLLLLVIVLKIGFKQFRKQFIKIIVTIILNLVLFLITASLIYYLSNPYVFLDTPSFANSMRYESSLALGTLPVFYTGEFFTSIPVLFQFTKIYPFLLNPLITILFIPSFLYIFWKMIQTKNPSYLLLTTFYLILFLSQAFLFAKWTRYMVPTLPFIFLIVSVALIDWSKNIRQPFSHLTILTIFFGTNTLFAFSYFITAFVHPDTRIEAYHAAQKTISGTTPILSEVYDLGIVPFNGTYSNITLFNFYDLDNNSPEATPKKLRQTLSQNDYIILPSQRIIKPRLLNKTHFPQGNKFYQQLTNGQLGYKKIYETPCDVFCNITYLGDPVFRFEQTANVFDRPTLMIFKKI